MESTWSPDSLGGVRCLLYNVLSVESLNKTSAYPLEALCFDGEPLHLFVCLLPRMISHEENEIAYVTNDCASVYSVDAYGTMKSRLTRCPFLWYYISKT